MPEPASSVENNRLGPDRSIMTNIAPGYRLRGPRRLRQAKILDMKGARLATIVAALAIPLAAPAHADPGCTPAGCPTTDIDFANQLHTYGIYGARDYNAWIGKIACERLYKGVDADAYKSHTFVLRNLPRGSTDVQGWQFLGTAITYYCPDQAAVLEAVSAQHS